MYKTKIKSGDTRKVDCSAAKRLLVVLTKECIPYALLRPLGPDGGDVDLLVEPGHEVKIINLSQRLGLSLLWERRKLRHCQLCFVNEKLNTIILDLQYEVLFERMRLWSREDILSKADLDDDLRILPQDWQVALLLLHCILDKKTWGRHRLVIQRILEEVLDTPDFIEDKLWCLLIDAFRKPSDGIDKHFRNKVRNILLKKRLMNIFAFYAGPGIILFEQLRWGLSGSGICVALIGVDGTGKTTVSRAAVDFLRDQHIPAIRIYRTQPEEYPFNTHIERTEKRNILRGLGQGLKRALKKQREINYCLKEANVLWLTFIWAIRLFLIIPWHKLRGRWIILDRYLYDMVTLDRDICRQKWFIGLVGRLRYGVSRFIYFQTTPEIIAERKNDNSIQEIERQMLAYGKLERYFTNIVDVSAPGREVARRVINILYMQKGLSNAGSFSLQKRRSADSKQVDFQVLQEVDPAWWNGLVASSPNGTLFQTTYWMEYVRAASGAVPYYLVWRDGDAVLGLSTLFYEPGRYKLFWRLAAGSPGRVFWRYGPVILNGGLSEWEESLASEALHIAKKHGAWSIYGIFPERTGSARPWLTSGYELKPWATYRIDLTQPLDTLKANLKPSARKNLKKINDEELEVQCIPENEWGLYDEMLMRTKLERGIPLPTYFPISRRLRILRTCEGVIIEVFGAKYRGELIAALTIQGYNGIINEVGVAHNLSGLQLNAHDAIKWAVIRWGHDNGYRFYDLSGVSLSPKDEKERGIYQFKAKWGGELVTTMECKRITSPFYRSCRQLVRIAKLRETTQHY